MKKRFLAFLLSGAMLLSTMPAAFAAETITIEDSQDAVTVQDESTDESTATSGTCGKNVTWNYDNGTLTISGTGKMKGYSSSRPWDSLSDSISTVVIEEGVTTIGSDAFKNCKALTSVTIPNSVTDIVGGAFENCEALTSVNIPNGVTAIGFRAFEGCKALTSIEIPNSVTTINSSAFKDCKALTNIEIPNSVTNLWQYAFYGCSALTSVTIPGSIATIGDEAFGECRALTSVNIQNGVTTIGSSAFEGCKALTSIEIPNSVTTIDFGAFKDCKALTSIEIPNSVTSLGRWAFYGCSALTSVTIPGSIATIGDWAFRECRALTSVNIQNGVTTIGECAFYDCDTLASVNIPNSVTIIDELAFNGCEALTSIKIPESVTTIGECAFQDCKALTSINIPNGVTTIGKWAFNICSALTSVTIPESVTSIGETPFQSCYNLENISVADKNVAYTSTDGVLFDKNRETLIQYPAAKKDTSYIIPSSVTTVGDGAFGNCRALTSVTIPDGVVTIGERTFLDCDGLTSVTIPKSVTTIGDRAFGGCFDLTSINVANGNGAYTSVDGVLFDKNTKTLIQYPRKKPDTSYIIPSSVTTVGDEAFEVCDALTSLTIPENVATIGDHAFIYCEALKTVRFLGDAPAINRRAFAYVNTRAYYPKGNETWTSDVLQDYEGVIAWFEWDSIQADVTLEDEILTVAVDAAETVLTDLSADVTADDITKELKFTDTDYKNATVTEQDGKFVTDSGEEVNVKKSVRLETTASLVAKDKQITFDVTPYVITTATIGNTNVEVKREEIHEITEPVTMKLELPSDFASVGEKVYITHKLSNDRGNKYYTAEVQKDNDGKLYITFENADGFSEFIVTKDAPKIDCNGNHSYDEGTVTKKATCTETGVKTFTCTVCGETKTEKIAKTAHTPETLKAVAATCTTDGKTAGSQCSVCKTVLEEPKVVEALGHDFCDEGKIIEAATCGKAGKENVTCSRCQTTEEREIPATGNHKYDNGVVTTEATCTAEGTKTLTCSVCGDQKTETIQKKDHTEVAISATPATCTEDGLTAGTKCDVCGEILVKQETVKALGHDYKIEVTKEPTTTEKGEKKLTCNRCGEEKTEEIPATGSVHSHTYKPETTKDATCTETGTVTYTCSCGAQYTNSIPAKGHTAESVKATAPTCTENGLTAGKKCSVCGITLEGQEVVKALGHNSVTDPLVKATRTKDGKTEGSHCSTCGEVLVKQETIYKVSTIKLKKKNHTYNAKKHKPGVIVKDSNGNTIDPSNYKVKYYGKRKKVGKYKVTVTLKGDQYKGKKTLYFTVRKK